QKFVAQANSTMRSFDQTGNGCARGMAITPQLHHADNRMQSGERICRNLRPRSRKFPQQCRFTCIRVTDQSGIRDRSQLQYKISLLALFAIGVLPRRTITRALEMHIAFSSSSASAKHEFLSVSHKIDKWNC